MKRDTPKAEAAAPKEEKIVMTLGEQTRPKPQATTPPVNEDLLAPRLIEENHSIEEFTLPVAEEKPAQREMQMTLNLDVPGVQQSQAPKAPEVPQYGAPEEIVPEAPVHLQIKVKDEQPPMDEEKKELERKKQWLDDRFEKLRQSILAAENKAGESADKNASSTSAASGGYLARPSNIYAESKPEVSTSKPADEKPVAVPPAKVEDPESFDMQLVIRNDIPAAETPTSQQTPTAFHAEEPAMQDIAEDQKRKAAERLQKLRNLSFNINAADPNNEFESVPAYIRRNMELYNTVSSVENFYSNYSVKDDGPNGTRISTINTFLDGKKPD
jgi:cell division protein FtsZ